MPCKCYHAERNFLGKIGVCWGTKECEACSCGGEESKCDFYDYVRRRASKNRPHWVSVTERLPETKDGVAPSVLTVDTFGVMRVAYFSGAWYWPCCGKVITTTVVAPITHWMYLPEPPNDEENITLERCKYFVDGATYGNNLKVCAKGFITCQCDGDIRKCER